MKNAAAAISLSFLLVTSSCTTPSSSERERGPDGTVAYLVPIDSSEPGTRIEVNGESVGITPMTVKIFGDRDGTFHNFGSYEFVVRAFPPGVNRPAITKIYHTGALMAQEDRIPQRISFDCGPKMTAGEVDQL
jgi:hypothetical protein